MEKVNFLIIFLGSLLAISYHVYGARISVINEEKLSKGGQCDPHVNPFKTTFVPHPSDCSKFFMCQFGRSHETKCPAGLHFNIESSKCDYPALAKCKLIPSGSAAPPICPMFGFETKGIPKICSKYIECVYGRPYVRSCPASLFWSETGKRCDYAHKSECMKGDSVVSPGGDENEVTYTPSCPHVLDKDSFVAHPSDCTKYFQCWNGNAFVRHCPSGLHWNAVTNRCDWPFRANCSAPTSTTPATEPTDSPTTESTGSPVIDTTQEPGEETTTDSSTTEIPTSPPKPPVTDAPGTETPGSEAPGTEATEEPGVDAPGIGEPETEAPEIEAPGIETPETEAPETEAPETEAPETEAPATETEIPGTEVTETEEPGTETPETETPGTAAPGTEVPETEAPETEVSVPEVPATELPETEAPETEAPETESPGTDAPATEVSTSTTDPRLNVSIPTFSTSPQPPHQTNGPIKVPQMSLSFVQSRFCPPETDMKPSVKFRDAENSSQYYECENGAPQLRQCAEGQEWSEILQNCDWPSSTQSAKIRSSVRFISVGCTSFLLRLGNTKVFVSCPSGLFWNQDLLACDAFPNADCLSERQTSFNICPNPSDQQHVPDSVRFANPNNCRKFVQCKDGFAYHLECPAGLLWNNELGHCDWPEYVSC